MDGRDKLVCHVYLIKVTNSTAKGYVLYMVL